jgi:hypothetical protein
MYKGDQRTSSDAACGTVWSSAAMNGIQTIYYPTNDEGPVGNNMMYDFAEDTSTEV